jgi:hypothetical protein
VSELNRSWVYAFSLSRPSTKRDFEADMRRIWLFDAPRATRMGVMDASRAHVKRAGPARELLLDNQVDSYTPYYNLQRCPTHAPKERLPWCSGVEKAVVSDCLGHTSDFLGWRVSARRVGRDFPMLSLELRHSSPPQQ